MAKKSQYRKALEEAYGIEPTKVHGQPTTRTIFYRGQLRKILMGMIDVSFNDDYSYWDKDYIKEGLLFKGLFTVTEDNNGVLLPLKCGITGVNVFNRPTEVIVANPVVGSFQRKIGEDCEIIYLESMSHSRYRNLNPVLDVFSQKLANCDAAIDIGIYNSRTTYIFRAANQNIANSFKAMFDEIGEGNPAVFVDEEIGQLLSKGDDNAMFQIKAKDNYVADLIQIEKHEVMNEFLTYVGINNANMTKREREIVDEVNSNNIAIRANVKEWIESVQDGCERVNKMFGCGLKISFPYYQESKDMEKDSSVDQTMKGGEDNEPT